MAKLENKETSSNKSVNNLTTEELSKLSKWQEKLKTAETEYDANIKEMQDNDSAYEGTREIETVEGKKSSKKATNVRKVVFEIIESQVDSNIPLPKVTSRRAGKEDQAIAVENFLKNEIDRLPFESLNDEQGRITPIAGGSIFYLEWDNSKRTRTTVGELVVKNLDPEQFIPQPGVYNLEDMDYLFIKFQQTKKFIKDVYGKEVAKENNDDPEAEKYEDLVTHVFTYYRNEDGGIGLFSWVGDTIVQDFSDYFARQIKVCKNCGEPKDPLLDTCKKCGDKSFIFKKQVNETISVKQKKIITDPATNQVSEAEETTEIEVPYYTISDFPIVIRKNVSKKKRLLGSSDVQYIKDQQNELNILMTKIREKILKGGSIVAIPDGMKFEATDDELKIAKLQKGEDVNRIAVHNLQPNVTNDLSVLELNYTIARQTIGITDSFQGRKDPTATSGKAKEFAAVQTAGRLESKRRMKDYSYSQLYELMFKFELAYADEPRPYVRQNEKGENEYLFFDKRMFLEQDDAGVWYYNDQFLFATDTSATLSSNREAMWQETRLNFTNGAYGPTNDMNTLVTFWKIMDSLHYPGAKQALQQLSERKEEQDKIASEQALMAQMVKNKTDIALGENQLLKAKILELEGGQPMIPQNQAMGGGM